MRRNGRIVSELDVYDFLVQGDKSKDLQLAAGDVVVFQPVGPQVALTGAVDSPAIYELRERNQPLGDLLRFAGGAPILSSREPGFSSNVSIRAQPLAARFVEQFRLDVEGTRKPLRDGDILTLLPISPQFANAVTLKGPVAQPLRSPHTPGMRIRDLIPGPEALISPEFFRRQNRLVQIDDISDGGEVAGAGAAQQPGSRAGSADAAALSQRAPSIGSQPRATARGRLADVRALRVAATP